jgi:hypothetical protein
MNEPIIIESIICERHDVHDNGTSPLGPAHAAYPIDRRQLADAACPSCIAEGYPLPHPLRFAQRLPERILGEVEVDHE